jgi:WD40 repeat protein
MSISISIRKVKLALGETNNDVGVYEVLTGKSLARLAHRGQVRGMSWRQDGQLLAIASGDAITLWQDDSWKDPVFLHGHEGGVTDVAFSRRGDLLASRSYDGTVRLWDVARRVALVSSPLVFTCSGPLCFSPDDRRLGFAWDRRPPVPVGRGQERSAVRCRRRSAGHRLSGLHPDGRFWHSRTGPGCFSGLGDGRETGLPSQAGAGRSVQVGRPPTADERQGGCRAGPSSRGQRTADRTAAASLAGEAAGVVLVQRTANGSWRTSREEAVLLDLEGAGARMAIHDPDNLHYVALTPDGRWVATAQWIGTSIRLTETASGQSQRLSGPEWCVAAVAFSPDGRMLAASTGKAYSVWDVGSWRLRYELPKDPAFESGRVAFAANGTPMAALYAPYRVHLIDPETGRQLAELQTPNDHTVIWLCLTPTAIAGGRLHEPDGLCLGSALAPARRRAVWTGAHRPRLPAANSCLCVTVEQCAR